MPLSPNHSLLGAVADEMADVRAGIEGLSSLVSDLVPHCPAGLRGEALVRAQAFDALIQRLEGLSGLVAALGAGVPAHTALEALTLTDLAERLAGTSDSQSRAPVSGDLMLFD